jgi:hypothetical protein
MDMRTKLLTVITSLGALTPRLPAQMLEVVPLPKTTIEHMVMVDGKIQKKETKDYVGIFGLPYASHPGGLPCERPPYGHREEVKKERVRVMDKEMEVTRTAWILKDPNGIANFNAQRITFWESNGTKAPAFLFPMKHGLIPLPAGTVQFEHLPRQKEYRGDPLGKRRITVTGRLIAEKEIVVSSRRIPVFIYSFETKSSQENTKGEFWLSAAVPGGLFALWKKAAGQPRRLRCKSKRSALKPFPKDCIRSPPASSLVYFPRDGKRPRHKTRGKFCASCPRASCN